MRITGIYKIEDLNGRLYIGSAKDFRVRWNSHVTALRGNRHANNRLQNYYNKYGSDALVFSLIKECSESDLMAEEQSHIDSLSPYFNICKTAGKTTGRPGGMAGKKLSPRRIAQISESNRRRILSDETKDKIRQKALGRKGVMAGKTHSQETKDKISASRIALGIILSPEHKAKLTFKGRKHSEEFKNRVSELNRSRKKSHV